MQTGGKWGNNNSPFSPYWGTPMYMPPEGNLLAEATDVYAVGLIMLQLLSPRFVTQVVFLYILSRIYCFLPPFIVCGQPKGDIF